MHSLSSRNEPFLFSLSARLIVRGTEPKLLLTLSEKAIEVLSSIPANARFIQHFQTMDQTRWGEFSHTLKEGEHFGFSQGLFYKGLPVHDAHDGKVALEIPLPYIVRPIDSLKASKHQRDTSEEYDHIPDDSFRDTVTYEEAFATTATLHVIFSVLSCVHNFDIVCSEGPYQAIQIQTRVESRLHGSSLGGAFSPFLTRLLQKHAQSINTQKVSKAMRIVWNHMMPNPRITIHDHEFLAEVRSNGTFFASCPGDRTCVHPSSSVEYDLRIERKGYNFTCHNVDTPAQQLTLLAGLAALWDEVLG